MSVAHTMYANHQSILLSSVPPFNSESQHQFSYITISNHNQEKRIQELMRMKWFDL